MDAAQNNVEQIIKALGGKENILSVTNCMTRLRVVVKEESPVNEQELKNMECVLGLVHDRACAYEIVVGPGKSTKYAGICHEKGLPSVAAVEDGTQDEAVGDWKENKAKIREGQKKGGMRAFLKVFGDIFIPLIPGVIAAGLCAGFASLLSQLVPGYAENRFLSCVIAILNVINHSFMTYLTAWAGYRAAERFGATPILGGMLGMTTSLSEINQVAMALGLYNESAPLSSVLCTGKGGVLAVILGVFVLSYVEKWLRKRMPDALDIVFTPLLTLLICIIPYVLLIMPLFGFVATAVCKGIEFICFSSNTVIRMIAGYVSTALFLPLVAMGMHHGLVAFYAIQLDAFGRVTLYPALAMAGAGQVGAALAIRQKAKKLGSRRLCSVIDGAVPAGILGVGEPLIYGVTLPMGKPFITAGLGAGFGGAVAMAAGVASTTWGPSGVLGVFVMTAGEGGAVHSVLWYCIGLAISYVMGFIITKFAIKDTDIVPETASAKATKEAALVENLENEVSAKATNDDALDEKKAGPETVRRHVMHGDALFGGASLNGNVLWYVIRDPVGIHARPAGGLVNLLKKFESDFVIEAGDRKTDKKSIIELMNLGAVQGTKLKITANGPDAEEALKEVSGYLLENL